MLLVSLLAVVLLAKKFSLVVDAGAAMFGLVHMVVFAVFVLLVFVP